jgi:hypothetical protein
MNRAIRTLRNLHRVFPWIGESNIYVREEALAFQRYLNPLERARDPILSERLSEPTRPPTPYESSVFILRMAEADAHNLIQRPWRRKSKWRQHLASVGRNLPPTLSLESVARIALELSGIPSEEALRSLVGYYSARAAGAEYGELSPDPHRLIFIPHRFCGQNDLTSPTGHALGISRAQFAWELWGMHSQTRNAPHKEKPARDGFRLHLRNLKQWNPLPDERELRLIEIMEDVYDRYCASLV